jgi:hypothetical protein
MATFTCIGVTMAEIKNGSGTMVPDCNTRVVGNAWTTTTAITTYTCTDAMAIKIKTFGGMMGNLLWSREV